MNKVITPEIREVMEAVQYQPEVSIIMPCEPKMNIKTELDHLLKIAADKVERELLKKYPEEMSLLVTQKLRAVIKNLDYNKHKKSIAIYVSPVFEKVLYLDIPVEEKIMVNGLFEIRDLVYSRKQLHKYLALVVSAKNSQMYMGDSETLVKIVSDIPRSVDAYINDMPERVANFSDIREQKEIEMEKFLHHIDKALGNVLNTYHLPLFVLGTERIMGHFKKHTRHGASVVEYVHGNYEETTLHELKKMLEPHIIEWKKSLQKDLLNQLEDAAGKKKLAVGMKEVWHEAMNSKGRLLVVEKNYKYAAQHSGKEDVIYQAIEPYNRFSYIKDAVDEVIEKVLEKGGDVEFVDENVLKGYHHIALIKFY